MIEAIRDIAVRRVFGSGVQGALAEKGIDWLTEQTGEALHGEPERLTEARLRPGDTYTVIARPPATRREHKLASRVESLSETEARLARTTRSQRRAARALARAQRRLDRRRPGTRRHRRAAADGERAGRRFDKVMAPSRKLVAVRKELAAAERELKRSRAASLRAARRSRPDATTRVVYR